MIVCLTPSKSDTGFGLSFLTASKAFSSLREEKNTSAANTSKMATSKSHATAPPLAPISTCLTHFASFITTLLLVLILSHLTPTTEAAQPEVRIKAVTYDWLCVLDINCTHQHPVHLSWKGYDYKTNHLSIKANSDMSDEPVVCSTYDHPRETTTVDIRDHCKFPPTVKYMLKKVLPIYFTLLSGVLLCLVFPAARYPSLLSAIPIVMANSTATTASSEIYTSYNTTKSYNSTLFVTSTHSVENSLFILMPILFVGVVVNFLVICYLKKKKNTETKDESIYPIYRRRPSMNNLTLITLACLICTSAADTNFKRETLEGSIETLQNPFTGDYTTTWIWNDEVTLYEKSMAGIHTFSMKPDNINITEDFSLLISPVKMSNEGKYEIRREHKETINSIFYFLNVVPDIENTEIKVESISVTNGTCDVDIKCGENDNIKTFITYNNITVKDTSLHLHLNMDYPPGEVVCFRNTSLQYSTCSLDLKELCKNQNKENKEFLITEHKDEDGKKSAIVFSVFAVIVLVMLIVIILSMKPKICFGTPVYTVILAATGAEANNCTNQYHPKNDSMFILVVILASLTCISLFVGIIKLILLFLFRCPGKRFDDDDDC